MLSHRAETERLIGEHLMVHQRVGAPVIEGAQRAHIRWRDAELGANICPEKFRNLLGGVKGAARHTHKADVDGAGQPVQLAAPCVDQGALLGRESEESG